MKEPHKLGDLIGFKIQARDGEIGKLEEIYFDDRRWQVRYFVVRTGGWLLGASVLVVPSVVTGVDEENKLLNVDLTLEQIKNCPPIDTKKPISRHYEQEYYLYYGWEPYWMGDPLMGHQGYMPYSPQDQQGSVPKEPEHPHLHSSDEVRHYAIHARDGDIGQVTDYILEKPDWSIRYLEVDTRKWLPGKHVLLSPAWIGKIDWAKSEVTVELSREAIETAPPYDHSKLVSRDYQVALYEHYGMKFHDAA